MHRCARAQAPEESSAVIRPRVDVTVDGGWGAEGRSLAEHHLTEAGTLSQQLQPGSAEAAAGLMTQQGARAARARAPPPLTSSSS